MVNCNYTHGKNQIHDPDCTKKTVTNPLGETNTDVPGRDVQQVLKWRIKLELLPAMHGESQRACDPQHPVGDAIALWIPQNQ